MFKCDHCEYENKTKQGLISHKGSKHKDQPQIPIKIMEDKVTELEKIVVELKEEIEDKEILISKYIFRGNYIYKKSELYKKHVFEIAKEWKRKKYCKTCEPMLGKHVNELLLEDKKLNKENEEMMLNMEQEVN
jgi:RNase P subunit RPR2